MSFKLRLYHQLWKFFKPLMVGNIKNSAGELIPKTRISNTTSIDQIEKLDLGENVFIGHFNKIDASSGVTIGEGCQLTNYISVLTHSSHMAIRLYGEEFSNTSNPIAYYKDSVVLGKYTFVGPHSVIMPGTSIGKGCIVSAYSYVRGSFEDFSIIAGNPAKKIGDTRKLDEAYLIANPELKEHYSKWATDAKI